jgi:serine/arginine repetitive matrix protein 2
MQASRNPPSASASLAASKAFIQNRESKPALSSAAAAAALRTHVTTPTPVGDVVTKRMVRKGSVSSQGSGAQPPPGLRRHSSSGSMTERTFRAPSPNRGSPSIDHTRNAPPVPALPKDIPAVSAVHRRAASVEPPFRVASPLGRGGGRGVSLDRGAAAVASPRSKRVTSLQQVPEDEQDGSPRSVNFSRPISPSPVSTAESSPVTKRSSQGGWFSGPVVNTGQAFRGGNTARPKKATGASPQDMRSAQRAVQNAADRPVSKHGSASRGVEGARLATGSMHTKPSGTAVARQSNYPVDPRSSQAVYDPSTRTFIHKQTAMEKHRAMNEMNEEEEAEPEPLERYVSEHEASPIVQSPPRQRMPQPSPVPFRNVGPPPQQLEQAPESIRDTNDYEERPNPGSVLARHTSEDFASADVRPSAVNDFVPENNTTAVGSPTSPRLVTSQESSYPRLGTPVMSTPTKKKTTLGASNIATDRTHSLSPARHAHFAAEAVELSNGVKPQPRSLSPLKSALKSSPAGSMRSSSPMVQPERLGSRFAPSDASDTMSEDGGKRKKKNVRVSFDESVIGGPSAYVESERQASPSRAGPNQSRWDATTHEQDLDDVMRPRPALPSFGSVRDKDRNREGVEMPEKVTETVSSSMSTSVASMKEPLEASNDHAVGGVLARDFATKQKSQSAPHDPLAPEVTSVEGSGYYSDSDESSTVPDGIMAKAVSMATPAGVSPSEPKTLTTSTATRSQDGYRPVPIEVPVIAVQPATPGLSGPATAEQSDLKSQLPSPFVPGGWADYDEMQETSVAPLPSKTDDAAKESVVNKAEALPVVELRHDESRNDESSDEDTSSIYSDAYEELTDTEDGGFASIDALVESPVVKKPQGLAASRYANESPEDERPAQQAQITPDWDATHEHWSGLIHSRKLQQETAMEQPVAEPDVISTTPIIQPPKAQPRKVQPMERKAPTEAAAKAPKSVQSTRIDSPPQPRKSALKKTPAATQSAPPADVHIRKSMRNNTGPPQSPVSDTHMRKSMRSNEPIGAPRASTGLAASRYSLPPPETRSSKGALQKKHIPAATTVPAAKPRPQSAGLLVNTQLKTAPKYDNDSDGSESSFRRERRNRQAARGGGGGDRYTMRGSMRGAPAPTMRAAPPSRPSSPPVTAPSPAPAALRKSLRPSSPTPEPSAPRSSRFSIRSLSPAGRFRQSKFTPVDAPPMPAPSAPPKKKTGGFNKPPRTAPAPTAPSRSKFKSRFDDSSDEEDGGQPAFRSRFADSDDEDEDGYAAPPALAPVRGIPKKTKDYDQDSTDLEDEASDEEPSTSRPAAKDIEKGEPSLTNGRVPPQGQSFAAGQTADKPITELPSFTPGTKEKAKRGFFSFGKKKSVPIGASEAELEQSGVDPADIPMPPPHRERNGRALTPIGEDDIPDTAESRRSPRLQRRTTPQFGRSTSDSWPLPLPPKIGEDARPQSSDGVLRSKSEPRPVFNKRQSSYVSDAGTARSARTAIDPKTGKEVIVGRSGKKKKFQGLRRVFGLND